LLVQVGCSLVTSNKIHCMKLNFDMGNLNCSMRYFSILQHKKY
jgi:hypothetical protein